MRNALFLSSLWLAACAGGEPPAAVAPSPVVTAPEVPTEPDASPQAKNLLIVLVDTLRADHLELYGHTQPVSRETYAWGVEGAVFDKAYSTAPWTKPSVATILTSQMPAKHGVTDWDRRLSDDKLTLTEHLKANGFATAAWVSHLALLPKETGLAQGFDSYDISVFEGNNPHKLVTSDQITDAGIGYLKAAPDERWFLMLHYFDPHRYYVKHDEWLFGSTDRAIYDSEIGFTDHHIGRLLDTLEAQGLADDTLVVFVSDHGEEFVEHGSRGHTVNVYQESIHVPLVLRGPGIEPQRIDEAVPLTDLAPTLAWLLGVPVPESFDGRTLRTYNRSFRPEPQDIISETRREADKRTVIRGDWKLIRDLVKDRTELFNIAVDPHEWDDRAAEEPERVAELGAVLDAYEALGDQGEDVSLAESTRSLLEQLGYVSGDE